MTRRSKAAPPITTEPLAEAVFGDGRLDAPATTEAHPTRRRILEAATRVFSAEGYRGATTREIAARAGVAEKTLFAHYPSKAAIFAAAMGDGLDAMFGATAMRDIAAAIATAPTLHAKLLAVAHNRVRFAAANLDLVKAIAQELLLDPEFRGRLRARFVERLLPAARTAIDAAVRAGVIREVAPERVLRMLISLVAGYVLTRHVLAPERAWDDDAEIHLMVETLLRGLAP